MSGIQQPITLLREVAAGPGSLVFAAQRLSPFGPRLLAVKVFREQSDTFVRRLLRIRDANRRLAGLGHRHIVAHHDVGVVGGHIALVSPWVDGLDLLDWVELLHEQALVLSARALCEILRAAASAVDAALQRVPHGVDDPLAMGHRDLKPTNLLVDRDGELKVVDFGAGFSSLGDPRALSKALQKGLTKYLAPGRRDGGPWRPADDVYGLGILALELFRNRWMKRFRSSNPAHDRALSEEVAQLGKLRMRADADNDALRSLLVRMVAYDPEARPTAAEVTQTFRSLADRAPGASLESMAHDHLVPFLLEVPDDPDPDLKELDCHCIDRPEEADLDVLPDLPWDTAEPSSSRWEETEQGWVEQEPVDDDITLTQDLADQTARALKEIRDEAQADEPPAPPEAVEAEVTTSPPAPSASPPRPSTPPTLPTWMQVAAALLLVVVLGLALALL